MATEMFSTNVFFSYLLLLGPAFYSAEQVGFVWMNQFDAMIYNTDALKLAIGHERKRDRHELHLSRFS